MPVLENSTYRAPLFLRDRHAQTILASFRPAPRVAWRREQIETPDGDFLELDWLPERDGAPLAVLTCGMESTSQSAYIRSTADVLHRAGLNVLAWNFRGCGGLPNRKVHFYHGAFTADLDAVVRHAIARGHGDIRLAGFSLGGGLTLNYLGREPGAVPTQVSRAISFSAPTDVTDCAQQLHRFPNTIYAQHFLRGFREKIRAKMTVMPEHISDEGYEKLRTLEDYDARYTVQHFGFGSVEKMYRFVSSRPHIANIRVPTLIVAALDDPFIGPDAFPVAEARANPNVTLETPAHGGHLGFLTSFAQLFAARPGWMERRVAEFLTG